MKYVLRPLAHHSSTKLLHFFPRQSIPLWSNVYRRVYVFISFSIFSLCWCSQCITWNVHICIASSGTKCQFFRLLCLSARKTQSKTFQLKMKTALCRPKRKQVFMTDNKCFWPHAQKIRHTFLVKNISRLALGAKSRTLQSTYFCNKVEGKTSRN